MATPLGGVVEALTQPQPPRQRRSRARNINVTTPNVNVTTNHARKRPRRRRVAVSSVVPPLQNMRISSDIPGPLDAVTRPIALGARGGAITAELGASKCCTLNSDAASWAVTYVDPAGAVEIGAVLGENMKIPDGLLKQSLGGAQRLVFEERCPGVSNSEINLNGALWSGAIIHIPCFRVAYIIVYNNLNAQLSIQVIGMLCDVLNNIVDWRAKVDVIEPISFADGGWFYQIRVFAPNYAIPDRSDSSTTSVESWRTTSRALEARANMPTLLNQGWWVGGHYPNQKNTISAADVEGSGHLHLLQFSRGGTRSDIAWEGIPPGAGSSPAQLPAASWAFVGLPSGVFSWAVNVTAATTVGVVTVVVPDGWIITVVPAAGGTPVTVGAAGQTFELTDNRTGTAFQIRYNGGADVLSYPYTGTDALINITTYNALEEVVVNRNRTALRLPPMLSSELVANNPKFNLELFQQGRGPYLVESKMQQPVFAVTPADQFGSLQFSYTGYERNHALPGSLGIRDSYDSNFSTGIMHWHGYSQASTLVVECWMGWEGVPAENTPMGQFAAGGLPRNDELLELMDTIQDQVTGVYDTEDNSAALIASIAVDSLSKLFARDATPAVVKSLAPAAIDLVKQHGASVVSRIPGALGRAYKAISARRARRRASRRAALGSSTS